MRTWLLASVIVAACGGPAEPIAGLDAAGDARVDPFAGRFDEPGEFPRTGCVVGSLTGFDATGYWPALGLKIEPGVRTRVELGREDRVAEHVHTADDLIVRATEWDGSAWLLKAIDICGVDADGTLHGAIVTCTDELCDAQPVAAVRLERLAGEGVGVGLRELGEYGGSWGIGTTSSVRVQGEVAYVARGLDGIRVVSIANPAAPVELSHFHGGNREVRDLELVRGVDGRRYLVAGGSPASQILDVTEPMNPRVVSELAFAARTVAVEFPIAYLVDGTTSQVEAYDISLPQSPKRIGLYEAGGSFVWHDLVVAGGIAYLSDATGSGMHVVDFRDPAHPRELAAEGDTNQDSWSAPTLTFVGGVTIALDITQGRASRLRLLDGQLGGSSFLAPLGEWSLRAQVSMQHIVARGARVYVAHNRDGVRVLDISDPTAPTQIGYFNTWIEGTGGPRFFEGAAALDVDRTRDRIYVADSIRGLVILQGDATTFP